MKNPLIIIAFLLCCTGLWAQPVPISILPTSTISVTCNKTTNLIFPVAVQNIDRGSEDILVQQPGGTSNIVQVKAGKPDFHQTNLTVITTDGKLYSFLVDYAAAPSQLNLNLTNGTPTSDTGFIQLTTGHNTAFMQAVAEKIQASEKHLVKSKTSSQVRFRITGIFISENIIYFRLELKNKSAISYEPGDIKFTIRDHQQTKRIASQELPLNPAYVYNDIKKLDYRTAASCVVALPKFTLSGSKYLAVSVQEKDGNRHLHLALKAHHLERAAVIPLESLH